MESEKQHTDHIKVEQRVTKHSLPIFPDRKIHRIFLLLISSLIASIALHAQYNPTVDSLINLANQVHETRLEKAIDLVEEVYRIGDETNDTLALTSALDYLGFYMDRKGDYEGAIRYHERSVALKKLSGNNSIAHNYSEIGYCNMIQGKYEKAREFMQMGADIAGQLGDYYSMGLSIYRLGEIYYRSGDLKSAMDNFERALHIGDSINELFIIYQPLSKLCDIYLSLDNYKRAMILVERSIAVADSLGDNRLVADAYARLGNLYEVTGDYDRAKDYYQKVLDISDSIAHTRGVWDGYVHLGDLAVAREQYTEALKLFHSARQIETSNRIAQSNVDRRIAKVYFELNKMDSAFFYSLQAYKTGEELHAPVQQYKPAYLLYQIYKKRGMSDKALYYYEVYHSIGDSLSTDEFEKELIRKELNLRIVSDSVEFAKENEIKDLEILNQVAELKSQRRQKIGFLGMGILGVIVSVLAIRSLQQKKKANRIIAAEKEEAEKQRKRSDELLLNILPSETAEELKRTGEAQARQFNQVTVLFTDFKEFTMMSEKLDPHQLVNEINRCFSAFDQIVEKYRVEKIKTIGDAYMAAGGLPLANETHAVDTVNAALDIQRYMQAYAEENQAQGKPYFKIRIGVHTGPVVAGIVGIKKFQYDIWGDTVNTASRMESSSEEGRVNISQITYELIKDYPEFDFQSRGKIVAKGKGEIEMYFVTKK